MRLLGQQGQQLGVRLGEGLRGFLIQFGVTVHSLEAWGPEKLIEVS